MDAMRKPLAAAALAGLLLLPLAGPGCGGDEPRRGDNAAAGPAGEKKPKADPLDAAIAAQEGYVYNPIGKRDPFRSFLTFGTRVEDNAPRTPLQKYEIDQYKLVGIVWGVDRPRALVQDPEGTGHVMELGTYIGRNWGKVTQIGENEVVVTEEYQTIDGELVVNPIKMTLVAEELQ